jgi:cytochrome P450
MKILLTSENRKYGKPPTVQEGLRKRYGVLHLFAENPGEMWRKYRTLSEPAFSDNNLKYSFETSIDKVTNDLINSWNEQFENKKQIEIDISDGIHIYNYY